MGEKSVKVQERVIDHANGMRMLAFILVGLFLAVAAFALGLSLGNSLRGSGEHLISKVLLVISPIAAIVLCVAALGFRIVNPNEALVLTLFGRYYGTIKSEGFYHVNPFVTAAVPAKQGASTPQARLQNKVSLKAMTLNNEKQKVNDALGNPIIIGAVAIWKVVNPTDAVFNVENYKTFLSIQCDSIIRKIARLYPYDLLSDDEDEEGHEKTLRGSSQEIAETMREELQKKVADAGIQVEEVRITHLSYAEEIAAAMLQKQQASAVIAARKKIVEGAVGMVQMAINQLGEEEIVVLDEERKAAMVSNLLVVLCGNKEAQPVVNSSSIY